MKTKSLDALNDAKRYGILKFGVDKETVVWNFVANESQSILKYKDLYT